MLLRIELVKILDYKRIIKLNNYKDEIAVLDAVDCAYLASSAKTKTLFTNLKSKVYRKSKLDQDTTKSVLGADTLLA